LSLPAPSLVAEATFCNRMNVVNAKIPIIADSWATTDARVQHSSMEGRKDGLPRGAGVW
jgi:hypothetical protein